jgi:hypothetical protein
VVDLLLDSRKAVKILLDQNKSYFTIKTFDELMSILDLKGEHEFSYEIFYIFGEYNNDTVSQDIIDIFGNELANKKVNFREVMAFLAFFRMDNLQAKITSKPSYLK